MFFWSICVPQSEKDPPTFSPSHFLFSLLDSSFPGTAKYPWWLQFIADSNTPISSSHFELLFFQHHVNTFTSCHFTTAISLRRYKVKNSVYTIKWSFKRLCKAPWAHLNSDSLYYPSQKQNPLSIPSFIAFLHRVLEVLKVWKSGKEKPNLFLNHDSVEFKGHDNIKTCNRSLMVRNVLGFIKPFFAFSFFLI